VKNSLQMHYAERHTAVWYLGHSSFLMSSFIIWVCLCIVYHPYSVCGH